MTSSTTSSTAEQLTLLPEPSVSLRFRLDDATRRRGLRHIAEIRAQLERSAPPAIPLERVTPLAPLVTVTAVPAATTSRGDVERPAA